MYCICLSRHRALSSKCRRGDASPPGEGSIPQLGNKKMYCICLSRHRALSSKCRRGDASPPGEGSIPQLGNKKMYCICLSRHRALSSKCRRGDASPPGEDAIPPGEDAFLALNEKINDRLMKINVQKKGSRSEPYLILFIYVSQVSDTQ